MNLQKKLVGLSEYKCSFKYVDSYFLVSMTYPSSWSVIPSEDRSIEVAEEGGVTFYAAPIETDIEKAFSLIDDTIAYNIDVEKKIALLKYNIGKLQELFAEKDLDELETIEFVFRGKKEAPAMKQTKKKTTAKARKTQDAKTTRNTKRNEANVQENAEAHNGDTEGCGYGLNFTETDDVTELCEPVIITGENKYLEEVER